MYAYLRVKYITLTIQVYIVLCFNKKHGSVKFYCKPKLPDSGPMTVSDLHRSVPNSSSGKKRKEFKRQKAHLEKEATETVTPDLSQQEPTAQSTIEEPILNRLRSRLDPTYNITNARTHAGAAMMNSDSLPESSTPTVDKPVKSGKKKRREKSRSTDINDQPTTTSETQLANDATHVQILTQGLIA